MRRGDDSCKGMVQTLKDVLDATDEQQLGHRLFSCATASEVPTLVFCSRCGAYGEVKAVNLAKP